MAGREEEDEAVLRLHAEQPEIIKRKIVTGSVRVSTVTHSREENIDEVLIDEHADVERIACGRFVDEMPGTRTVGDTVIVPVVEEVLVVERRLFLKEEIHIRRSRVERHHTETITLREQSAVIENIGSPANGTA